MSIPLAIVDRLVADVPTDYRDDLRQDILVRLLAGDDIAIIRIEFAQMRRDALQASRGPYRSVSLSSPIPHQRDDRLIWADVIDESGRVWGMPVMPAVEIRGSSHPRRLSGRESRQRVTGRREAAVVYAGLGRGSWQDRRVCGICGRATWHRAAAIEHDRRHANG